MALRKAVSGITKGADLLHPKLSLSYILAAIVAVSVLILVFTGGKWLYAKAAKVGQGLIPQAKMPDFRAQLGI